MSDFWLGVAIGVWGYATLIGVVLFIAVRKRQP